MSEPVTAAAELFIAHLRREVPWFVGGSETVENDLLAAIEREAAALVPTPPDALDVERLAKALRGEAVFVHYDRHPYLLDVEATAAAIAAAYAEETP